MKPNTTVFGLLLWATAVALWIGATQAFFANIKLPGLKPIDVKGTVIISATIVGVLFVATIGMRFVTRSLKHAGAWSAAFVGLLAYLIFGLAPQLLYSPQFP